jgi:hypothetical protein
MWETARITSPVQPDQDAEPVRRFECFTADLHRLADWLLLRFGLSRSGPEKPRNVPRF